VSLNLGRTVRRGASRAVNLPLANAVLHPWRAHLLNEALNNGLPSVLEGPLRSLFTEELTAEDQRRVERVERLRSDLAASETQVTTEARDEQTSVRRLAVYVSVDRRIGTFLYLCAKATQARAILELGSGIGIGMSYMASAGCERIISVEAAPERADIARATVRQVKPDAEVIVGFFDDVLGDILPGLAGRLDLAWIDGHHQKEPTLRYLDRIKPVLNPGALVVFDDIKASDDMREAWGIIQRTKGFSHTIDLKYIGVGVWEGEGAIPRFHDLRGLYGRPWYFTRK
jgi:predicted O-methyltransferase YrrM